jgi:hypothetical protein
MGADSVSRMPLTLMPGTAVLRSRWPLIEIWKCKDRPDGEISVELENTPSIVLVYRHGYQSYCAASNEAVARFIEAMDGGTTLSRLEESLGADGTSAAESMLKTFRRMVGEGLFRKPDA